MRHLFFGPSSEKLPIHDAAKIAAADDGVLLLTGGGGEDPEMPIEIEAPYARRSIRFLELWGWQGWRLKVYGICRIGAVVSPDLVVAAKNLARARLPAEATGPRHYGVGFVIIHEGANGDYVFVDWWFDVDIVQHHLYGAPKGHGGKLHYRWPEGAGFCVWELAVCCFEREAWIETVLSRPPSPNLDDYLARRMNEDV